MEPRSCGVERDLEGLFPEAVVLGILLFDPLDGGATGAKGALARSWACPAAGSPGSSGVNNGCICTRGTLKDSRCLARCCTSGISFRSPRVPHSSDERKKHVKMEPVGVSAATSCGKSFRLGLDEASLSRGQSTVKLFSSVVLSRDATAWLVGCLNDHVLGRSSFDATDALSAACIHRND